MMRSQRAKKMALLVCMVVIPTFAVLMYAGSVKAQDPLDIEYVTFVKGQTATVGVTPTQPTSAKFVIATILGSTSVTASLTDFDEGLTGKWALSAFGLFYYPGFAFGVLEPRVSKGGSVTVNVTPLIGWALIIANVDVTDPIIDVNSPHTYKIELTAG